MVVLRPLMMMLVLPLTCQHLFLCVRGLCQHSLTPAGQPPVSAPPPRPPLPYLPPSVTVTVCYCHCYSPNLHQARRSADLDAGGNGWVLPLYGARAGQGRTAAGVLLHRPQYCTAMMYSYSHRRLRLCPTPALLLHRHPTSCTCAIGPHTSATSTLSKGVQELRPMPPMVIRPG